MTADDQKGTSLFEKREFWDAEDRDMHLQKIVRNHKEYISKGSFGLDPDDAPDINNNNDGPKNSGPTFKK